MKKENEHKLFRTISDLYGMLMVLLIEVENQRTRKDGKKYHWDDIESDWRKYAFQKMKELYK
jgi:hypothetical protein